MDKTWGVWGEVEGEYPYEYLSLREDGWYICNPNIIGDTSERLIDLSEAFKWLTEKYMMQTGSAIGIIADATKRSWADVIRAIGEQTNLNPNEHGVSSVYRVGRTLYDTADKE